ncbi:glycosyltransferase [Magnetospirillum sp. 15-1]|uniref:glycosyltransferase n=1 Tax=Magnetospirillum sp. 15-1 TaxID=1979370 RepID=UPI000BBCB2FF|nr:glycosyltransferase [Magnetospirillum sp. 15-1]
MQAKRLLIVVGGVPHPTEGASVVLFHKYIDGFRQAGYDILTLILAQPDNARPERLAEWRAAMEGPKFQVRVAHSPAFVHSGRRRCTFDHAALAPVRAEIEAFRPDAALLFDLASAWAMDGWSIGRRTVWLGDLNFDTYLYHTRYARREGQGNWRHFLMGHWRSWQWKRIYARVLRGCERIVVASKSSEARLARLGLEARYMPYPWPSEPADPAALGPKPAKPTFFFFGQLAGLGSRSAFHLMTEGIYPRLREAFGPGGFEILIGGRGDLPGWVVDGLNNRPELRYLGFVEDLDRVMGGCHAVLAPIDVPVGNRSRILTALAKGMLVVAHTNTALGNPDLVDGQSCWLASTPEEFVDRLRRAVEQTDKSAAVALGGQRVYKQLFAPEVAVPALIRAVAAGL